MQYGCGWHAPETWRNFDASPTLFFERLPLMGRLYTKNERRFPRNVRYGDIVRGLPVLDDSCAGVFCSHVLEHLSLRDFEVALANTYRYLRPHGIFRCILPDLEVLIRDYLQDSEPTASLKLMDASCLGQKDRPRGGRAALAALLGNSAHRWMWDAKALTYMLQRHGFRHIRRAAFGDSEDGRFKDVEVEDRFLRSFALECRK